MNGIGDIAREERLRAARRRAYATPPLNSTPTIRSVSKRILSRPISSDCATSSRSISARQARSARTGRHQHARVSIGEEERDMKYELTPPARAMEAGGAYNKNAKLPACGGAFAISQLENAARSIAFGSDSQPIVIADYGSSQGRNSLSPMRVAIEVVRARLGSERPIFVFHEDLPENDFNSLFEVLNRDPQSYALHAPNVFPCAIGRSFYKSVLPPNHVHLGWCSYAAMWISRFPRRFPVISSFRAAPARCARRSTSKERKIGKRSCPCGPAN